MEPNGRGRPASRKQLAYIKQLRSEIGDVNPDAGFDLSSAEASQLIGKLMGRLGGNGLSTGNGYSGHIGRINEPRLGMSMKEWSLCRYRHKGYNADFRIIPTDRVHSGALLTPLQFESA